MARKDSALDEKIAAAAWQEFSQKGYAGASLRKIAEQAGATVGAIQTRYPSKDALFTSLLKPFLDGIEATFCSVKADYYSGGDADFLAQLESSMRHESEAILHLIFDHYGQAKLLFCGSAGSSLEHYFDRLVKSKIEESVRFFRSRGEAGIDERLLGLLISVQFDSYRRIVADCPDYQSAERCIHALMTYHLGGWTALFSKKGETL